MDRIRVAELFAGVGGFRLGLEAASSAFQTVWANQWEPYAEKQYAFECYVAHFGASSAHVCQDVAFVKEEIPDHDLLVGGFPCQDYSVAKKNARGIEGAKGKLWWQIDSILKEKRPKYVLLENVDRLIRSPAKQKGRDFSIILRCFYENGYAAEWRVVNAADYGQAQRRRRTFIFAFRNDTAQFKSSAEAVCIHGLKAMHRWVMSEGLFASAFPLEAHSRKYVDNWIDELEYTDLSALSRQQQVLLFRAGMMMNGRIYSVDGIPCCERPIPLRDSLLQGSVDARYFLREENLPQWRYAKGAKREQRKRRDGTNYIFSEGAVAFPEPLDKPSRTLLTSESTVGRSSHVVTDIRTGKLRTLTPVECERLNGFPDGWTDTGMPERMRYFTMGNAVVVPLIQRIGTVLAQRYDGSCP